MSVYLRKGRGWKFDFTLGGRRHTSRYYKTKAEAKRAEAARREELLSPKPAQNDQTTPTDMAFLELVNRRLDHVKAYNSEHHYLTYRCLSKKWVERWRSLMCSAINQAMIEEYVLERSHVSAYTANREIRTLRATFNWAKKRGLVDHNPTDGIEFMPEEKKIKYVPPPEDIDKVIAAADPDTQDYLWTIRDTMGRMGEINRLTWEDVNFEGNYVVLYTRKKRGGHLIPRKVPMTSRLHKTLKRRYENRDPDKPWVFWHTYTSSKTGKRMQGPYRERKKIMRTLCKKAGVQYFRFHALRHAGASVMDNSNVSIGSIQRILGHENRTTTEIYLHSIGKAEREAITVFERASKKSHPNPHPNKEKGLRLVT